MDVTLSSRPPRNSSRPPREWAARLRLRPRRILDLGAGAGVWGQRARLVFPEAEIMGVEIRRSERRAARHYDQMIWGDYLAPRTLRAIGDFRPDLVVSNPPFTLARHTLLAGLDAVTRQAGLVLLLLRSTFGDSEEDDQQLRRCPAVESWDIPGRLHLRSGVNEAGDALSGDYVRHMFYLAGPWRYGAAPTWPRHMLPPLPSAWLRWTVRPGDEEKVAPLPSEFWPRGDHG
ncbi:methyltransferase [Nannocystis sp. ILAH1]|uniref:methyltransferase n=1 Tax=Nannocystis sp. ILAH1 TaxID=2996789 RepID=UPI00226D40D5|nr:methyltransferase [Nannocystis sp. ILAH1]MCY0994682.1 methyltransferase [Nannocystis sp. ILAH1]